MSSLIALDLGSTIAGCAIFEQDQLVRVETWRLRKRKRKGQEKEEHPGAKWMRFREHLNTLGEPDYVAYEKVRMHSSSFIRCPRCGIIKNHVGTGKQRRCTTCGGPATRIPRANVDAAHAYGGCEAFLLEWCWEIGVIPIEIHTTAVKQVATGKGAGSGTAKADIVKAAKRRWPGIKFTPDAADAAFVGLAAALELGWVGSLRKG